MKSMITTIHADAYRHFRNPLAVARQLAANVKNVKGCWLWQSATNRTEGDYDRGGYALTFVHDAAGRRKRVLTHRTAYILAYGDPPPDRREVGHATYCPCRHCINPAHLNAETHAENMSHTRGVPHKKSIRRHPGLSVAQVLKLRKLRQKGTLNVRRAARVLHIDPASVRRAATGRSYREVT